MASTLLQTERFVKIINQQLEILKEERNTVIDAVDNRINQVQREVNDWIHGGQVNHTSYAEMNNRIQEILSLFIDKSFEFSAATNMTNPGASSKFDETKMEKLTGRCETVHNLGAGVKSDASHNVTMRFAVLEEAVYSLKNTSEKVEDKIGNIDKMLKDISTQQVNENKKVDNLRNAKLKLEKKLKNKNTDVEKRFQDTKSKVDHLFETVSSVDDKLNRLEDENKSLNVSMNELNKEISSVRTCSNDALMSIQDLSKSVDSTNQHYNEMSNKMNQLEISINLMSYQYTDLLDNMECANKHKTDDLIGLVCQLLAKRLTPLEKLNETLNMKVISGDKQFSEKDSTKNRVAEISNTFPEIEPNCNLPKVGVFAWKVSRQSERIGTITQYDQLYTNHGDHFDPSTGIFTAPVNGLYLITIMTECPSKIKTNTINCYHYCNERFYDRIFFHCVPLNQTVTRCAEISAGGKLCLNWETNDQHDKKTMISIAFSCYLIQKL